MTSLWSVTEAWRSVVIGLASGLFAGAVIWLFPQPLSGGSAVLALHLLGHRDVAVYDGSWTEWGGRTDTPVETGAAG